MIEVNKVSLVELIDIHTLCDRDFIPPLSGRVDIRHYCEKLLKNAVIISYRSGEGVEGVLGMYCNDLENKAAFISTVCVHPRARGRKIGSKLLDYSIEYAGNRGMETIGLETGSENTSAIGLYGSRGFTITAEKNGVVAMNAVVRDALAKTGQKSEAPAVSIIMVTYNHRPYISQAIEGVIAQKTDFPFELIVADDASTDGNQEIILQYASRYPDRVMPVLHERNIGANPNWFDAFERTRGKYIAICEGDDYWIDPEKLQRQTDILDRNPAYGMVCTDYARFFQSSGSFRHNCFNTRKYRGEVRFGDYLLDMSSIGTATVLIRKEIVRQFLAEIPPEVMSSFVGSDTPLWLFTAAISKVAVLPIETAVYRFLEKSACHFPDPHDHYRFVLRGFEMADYFFQRYGKGDTAVARGLNRKKLRAALFHGYRTLNHRMAKDAFRGLRAHRLNIRQLASACLMLAGSRSKSLQRVSAFFLRMK